MMPKIALFCKYVHERKILQDGLVEFNKWTNDSDLSIASSKCASLTVGRKADTNYDNSL